MEYSSVLIITAEKAFNNIIKIDYLKILILNSKKLKFFYRKYVYDINHGEII
jgi:hypothetical protein